MQTKPSATSLVFAAIISNPGIDARTLKGLLADVPSTSINAALFNLKSRGAIKGDDSMGPRSLKYYKSNVPVVLRKSSTEVAQAAAKVEMFDKASLRQEIAQGINLLSSLLVKLEKI